jgi:ERCC4-related helicase
MRLLLVALPVIIAAAAPAGAQSAPNKSEQVRERINKAWDERLEKMREAQIASRCKADSKQQYSAIRFNKRRIYVEDCIAQAHTIVVDRAGTTP